MKLKIAYFYSDSNSVGVILRLLNSNSQSHKQREHKKAFHPDAKVLTKFTGTRALCFIINFKIYRKNLIKIWVCVAKQ